MPAPPNLWQESPAWLWPWRRLESGGRRADGSIDRSLEVEVCGEGYRIAEGQDLGRPVAPYAVLPIDPVEAVGEARPAEGACRAASGCFFRVDHEGIAPVLAEPREELRIVGKAGDHTREHRDLLWRHQRALDGPGHRFRLQDGAVWSLAVVQPHADELHVFRNAAVKAVPTHLDFRIVRQGKVIHGIQPVVLATGMDGGAASLHVIAAGKGDITHLERIEDSLAHDLAQALVTNGLH